MSGHEKDVRNWHDWKQVDVFLMFLMLIILCREKYVDYVFCCIIQKGMHSCCFFPLPGSGRLGNYSIVDNLDHFIIYILKLDETVDCEGL
jgi:hypothetical protein